MVLVEVGCGPIYQGNDEIGLQTQDSGGVLDGCIEITFVSVGFTAIDVGLGQMRVQVNGGGGVLDRSIESAYC